MSCDVSFDYEWFYDSFTFIADALAKYSNCVRFLWSKGDESKLPETTPLMRVLEEGGVLLEDMCKIKELYSEVTRRFLEPDENSVANASCYRDFVNFLALLKTGGCEIEIHTLNHDLLLEGLLSDGRLEYADGYAYPKTNDVIVAYEDSECSSEKFFARVFNSNNFNSQINLYKLHGSVDSYWVSDVVPVDTMSGFENSVKVDSKYSKEPVFFKGHLAEGHLRFVGDCGIVSEGHSDFLTGTTSKLRHYNERHYKVMLRKFEENIRNTDLIIVIGYGWRDSVINGILKQKKHSCQVVSVCGDDANAYVEGILSCEDLNETNCDDMCDLPILKFSRLEDVIYRDIASILCDGLRQMR